MKIGARTSFQEIILIGRWRGETEVHRWFLGGRIGRVIKKADSEESAFSNPLVEIRFHDEMGTLLIQPRNNAQEA